MGLLKNILEEISAEKNPSLLYHGSPYKFERFSMSKINTGQKSQDFGYGLYFTTDRETAVFYANELSNHMTLREKYDMYVKSVKPSFMLSKYMDDGYSISVKRTVNDMIKNGEGDPEELKQFLDSIDSVKRYGYLYTVEISNPNYITRDEYTDIMHKNNIPEKEMPQKLRAMGYNGIIYEMNTRHCSDRDFSGEWNVVIIDDSVINVKNCEKVEFDGYLKLKI